MPHKIIEKKGPFDVIEREVVVENPWFYVEKDLILNRETEKNGTYNVIRNRFGAVGILPIDEAGNVYLVKEYKYAIDEIVVGDVGGFIEEGESPIDAAKRELLEELGISASDWSEMGELKFYTSINDASYHLFLASDLSFGETKWDDNESIVIVKVPLAKARDMVLNNEIVLASAVTLILKAWELRAH